MEAVEDYNKRAKKILEQYRFKDKDFAILGKGRSAGENSVVLVENSHYVGFGYYDSYEAINSPEQIRGFVSRKSYYPDCDDLVRFFVKQGKGKVIKLDVKGREVF